MSETVKTPINLGDLVVGAMVTFEGRDAVIIAAYPVRKSELTGEPTRTIVVKDYAGEHMIGSTHSALALA